MNVTLEAAIESAAELVTKELGLGLRRSRLVVVLV